MTRALLALHFLALLACPPMPAPDAGVRWTNAFDTSSTGWLLNAWGSSPADVYAVGGRADGGVVMHFDGTAWQRTDPGLTVPLFNWAHGFSPSDVFVVGNEGTVLHFDGATWTRQATPTKQPLWGVWGASNTDLWAVGGDGQPMSATLLHFDGSAWTTEIVPPLQKQRVGQFLKVWGRSADDVYVVGQRGVVLHRTQGAWREELVGASDDLVSIWGVDGLIVAVGGRSNGIVSTFNGTLWSTTNLAPLPGLNGVWLRTKTSACVAGAQGTLGRLDLSTLEFTPEIVATTDDLHSCFGIGSTLIAVGGNLESANPPVYRGVAVQRPLAESP